MHSCHGNHVTASIRTMHLKIRLPWHIFRWENFNHPSLYSKKNFIRYRLLTTSIPIFNETLSDKWTALLFLPFVLVFWGLLMWRFTVIADFNVYQGNCINRHGFNVEECEAKMVTFYVFTTIMIFLPLLLYWKGVRLFIGNTI